MEKIIEKIRSDNSISEYTAEELTKRLNDELEKESPDFDLIDELNLAILEAKGIDCNMEEAQVRESIDNILQKANKHTQSTKRRRIRCPKWLVGLSAACIAIVMANIVSYVANSSGIFYGLIRYTDGGFTVNYNFQGRKEEELSVSKEDPYGFVAKLAECDIVFETPHYLPEGFKLDYVSTNKNSICSSVYYIFKKNNQDICISFDAYHIDTGQIGIPSDHFNPSEREVNGATAIVSKEDNQYTIVYEKNKVIFCMSTQDVPYEECEKIVDSIK